MQRVPKTEKAGRIHTSTVAVAIIPRPSEVTVKIDPKVGADAQVRLELSLNKLFI